MTYAVFIFNIFTATVKLSAHCELEAKKPATSQQGCSWDPNIYAR